jgi:hypothetical protein
MFGKEYTKKKITYLLSHKIELLFMLFVIISASLNTIWILKDNHNPTSNGFDFILEAIRYYRNFHDFNKMNYIIFKPYNHEPPLISLILLPFYWMFNLETKKELIINSIFLVILLLSVYKIGEKIYNKKVGFLASILINSFFITIYLSRNLFREFHLCAFVALSFWFMLRTDYFSNRKNSIYLGIILGLTSLIKYSFWVHVLPYLTIYIIFSVNNFFLLNSKKNKEEMIHIFKNIFLVFFFFLIFGGFWYIININQFTNKIKERLFLDGINNLKIQLFKNIDFFYHFDVIFKYNLGSVLGILMILSLVKILSSRRKSEETLLLISFIFPYIILSLVPQKCPELLFPSYFSLPILISKLLLDINKRLFKKLILFLIIIYALIIIVSPFIEFSEFQKNNFFPAGPYLLMQHTPSIEPSIIENIFSYLSNLENKSTFLIISSTNEDFGDFIYFIGINRREYNIYNIYDLDLLNKYKLENRVINNFFSYKWYLADNSSILYKEFNASKLISEKQIQFIIFFLPQEEDKNKSNDSSAYELFKQKEFNENYILLKRFVEDADGRSAEIYKLKN